MKKKKGYGVLLSVTKLFTLTFIAAIVFMAVTPSYFKDHLPRAMLLIFTPFLLAACTCAVRKRFFTEKED